MTMSVPKNKRVLFFLLFVLANNLAWSCLVLNMRFDSTPVSGATAREPERAAANYKSGPNDGPPATLVPGRARDSGAVPLPPKQNDATATSPAQSPVGTPTEGIDVPFHLSQDALLHRHLDLEYFFQGDAAKKLRTIEGLSPHGEALELLTQILQSEPDINIRIAAVSRLRDERSYAATSLAIGALDDRAPEVSAAALDTLVAAGDRTLVPLLKVRLASVDDQRLRTRFAEAIHDLEYSASMAVDGVRNP